jgi:primosomal protein N'
VSNSASLSKISPKHDEIMNYMLMYPLASRAELAAHFQVTRAWLATVTNSDLFQARLQEKQKEIFGEVIVDSVRERLSTVASLSLERLLEKVEVSDDERFLLDASLGAAKALGFAPAKANGPTVQINQFQASAELLAQARSRIIEGSTMPAIPEGTVK